MMRSYWLLLLIGLGSVSGGGCWAEESTSGPYIDVQSLEESAKITAFGGIAAAGQPDERALQLFADAGFVAVVDMRGPTENRGMDEAASVTALGLQYLAFPIVEQSEISFEKARELDELLHGIDGPVLIHCASSNRVGALLALRERLHGASIEEALAFGRSAGMTRLEGLVRQKLAEK
jgi:uncharacterized protein (TIGR01244 family)